MSKPILGLILGAALGVLDGLTALLYPDTKGMMLGIIIGSTGKGLIAGVIIGFVARKLKSLPIGVVVGLVVGFLITLPFAVMPAENGQTYFWEIIIPGSLVGLILGFATQRYGRAPRQSAAVQS
jgi:MFS family permease